MFPIHTNGTLASIGLSFYMRGLSSYGSRPQNRRASGNNLSDTSRQHRGAGFFVVWMFGQRIKLFVWMDERVVADDDVYFLPTCVRKIGVTGHEKLLLTSLTVSSTCEFRTCSTATLHVVGKMDRCEPCHKDVYCTFHLTLSRRLIDWLPILFSSVRFRLPGTLLATLSLRGIDLAEGKKDYLSACFHCFLRLLRVRLH